MDDFDKITNDLLASFCEGKNKQELEVFVKRIKSVIKDSHNAGSIKNGKEERREEQAGRRDQGWERNDRGWERKEISREWIRATQFSGNN